MQRLDLSLRTPAEYLAADEALLDWCESGQGGEMLALWEPLETFVVVGYANQVATEVNVSACEARGIPIHRRCSGGGTVVQMPGGLNYALVLRISENGPTRNISSANQYIMEKNRAAVQSVVGESAAISIRGHTDLAIASPAATFLKFAGNSQRRRKHFLLFHGTFLLNCDLRLIGELLRMPSLQPDYRAGRPHEKFVTNLNLPAVPLKTALAQAWEANERLVNPPLADVETLAREKYATDAWNHKF